MIHTLEREVEYTYDRSGPRVIAGNRIEPYYIFEAGDFEWSAADIEFYFKLWFYHWILYGTSDILNKPIPASFVYCVRRKCSTYGREENHAVSTE